MHDSVQRFSSEVFRRLFERGRTGGPGVAQRQRAAVAAPLAGPYADQLDANSPARSHAVEISPDNHAILHRAPDAPVDLGAIPHAVNADHLSFRVVRLLEQWPDLPSLFTGPGGTKPRLLYFTVVHAGRPITQGAVLRPGLAAP